MKIKLFIFWNLFHFIFYSSFGSFGVGIPCSHHIACGWFFAESALRIGSHYHCQCHFSRIRFEQLKMVFIYALHLSHLELATTYIIPSPPHHWPIPLCVHRHRGRLTRFQTFSCSKWNKMTRRERWLTPFRSDTASGHCNEIYIGPDIFWLHSENSFKSNVSYRAA